MAKNEGGNKLEKFLDIIGELLAVLMIATFIVLLANAQFEFIGFDTLPYKILKSFLFWGCIALVLVVGAEAISKRNWFFKILFLLCAAIIIIFMCFPDTYQNLIGLIPAA